jgi:hypothetical protein
MDATGAMPKLNRPHLYHQRLVQYGWCKRDRSSSSSSSK